MGPTARLGSIRRGKRPALTMPGTSRPALCGYAPRRSMRHGFACCRAIAGFLARRSPPWTRLALVVVTAQLAIPGSISGSPVVETRAHPIVSCFPVPRPGARGRFAEQHTVFAATGHAPVEWIPWAPAARSLTMTAPRGGDFQCFPVRWQRRSSWRNAPCGPDFALMKRSPDGSFSPVGQTGPGIDGPATRVPSQGVRLNGYLEAMGDRGLFRRCQADAAREQQAQAGHRGDLPPEPVHGLIRSIGPTDLMALIRSNRSDRPESGRFDRAPWGAVRQEPHVWVPATAHLALDPGNGNHSMPRAVIRSLGACKRSG